MARVRAIQRTTRQSPYKMRLVIDQIRGKNVNDALALLTFSKKHAAKQISKTLKSAVAKVASLSRFPVARNVLSMLSSAGSGSGS